MTEFDYRGARKAIFASALRPNPRLVLLALLEYMPTAYPGKAKLRDETGLSVASIKRSLLDLERMGVLVVDRSKASTGHDSNTIVMADDWNSKLPVRGGLREPRIRRNPVSDRTPPEVCETPPGVHCEPTPGVCVNPKAGIQAGSKQEGKQRETPARGSNPSSGSRSSKSKSPKAIETLMPSDWQPTAEHIAFAGEQNLDIAIEVVKFKGHFDGKSAASWNGRFATWLGNAVTFAKRDADRTRASPRKVAPPQRGIDEHVQRGNWFDDEPTPQANPQSQLKLIEGMA